MAEQSFLNKLGMRFGTLGISASLAMAAPLAAGNYSTDCQTDVNRIGWFFDRTAAAEKLYFVVGGSAGVVFTRSGTTVQANIAGVVTIGDATTTATLSINGAASNIRDQGFQTAAVIRWVARCDATAESGSNAGSLYAIIARHDNGTQIDVPFQIQRNTATPTSGAVTLARSVLVTTNATPQFILAGPSSLSRRIDLDTASISRWQLLLNSTAETGSNVGSNFQLSAFTDAGATIDAPIFIFRVAFGPVAPSRPVLIAAGTLTGTQTLMSATATWSNVATTFTAWRMNVTDTNSTAGSLLMDLQLGSVSRCNIIKSGIVTQASVDDLTSAALISNRAFTLTGGIADVEHFRTTTALAGAFTVTRYNWIELDTPTDVATVTDATVFYFDANAGTHKCLDAGTTKTSPGTVSAWIKHNINGTIYYSNAYTSKTT